MTEMRPCSDKTTTRAGSTRYVIAGTNRRDAKPKRDRPNSPATTSVTIGSSPMKKLNLMLHQGASFATIDEVRAAPTPEPNGRHWPIPHISIVDTIREELEATDMRVVGEAHGLTKDGNRYFGLLQIENGHSTGDYATIVGVRNSHDKRFAAAIALGAGVFVCDNLSFCGEVTLARIHTRNIVRDLPRLTNQAVGKLGDFRKSQGDRIAAYKTHSLTNEAVHDFVVRSVDSRVISNKMLPAIISQWRKPLHEDFESRTLWSLFNCYTEMFKELTTGLLQRSQALHGMCDVQCDYVLAS